ncbi:GntR family transcriptional regulator [Parasphingorhabdus sp.]|uniref:GntR family transcriptional regulator n=1 Tax=Parasphingorhabdus sp. TaxID=2709688 RepID=UPI003A94CED5
MSETEKVSLRKWDAQADISAENKVASPSSSSGWNEAVEDGTNLSDGAAPVARSPDASAAADGNASLVSHVVDSIVDGVMAGRFAPGQRLIAADLADEYAVSRAPVREALHMLAGEGVVELVANRGARIRRLSVDERIDFLEFTEAICVLGVRLASGKLPNPEYQAQLDIAFCTIEEAWTRRHARDFVDSLYRYHMELNKISGNGFVEFFYRRPYIRFYTTLLADIAPGNHWEQYIYNYRLLHETILLGDANSAEVCFSSHIRWVLRNMRHQQEIE